MLRGVYVAPNMRTILLCERGLPSPYAKILASLPVRIRGVPVCIRGSGSWRISDLSVSHALKQNFVHASPRTLALKKTIPSLYHIISIALHSLFAFGDISHSLSIICDIIQFYHFTLWTLYRQPYPIWEMCQLFRHSRKLPKSIPSNRKVLSWILG